MPKGEETHKCDLETSKPECALVTAIGMCVFDGQQCGHCSETTIETCLAKKMRQRDQGAETKEVQPGTVNSEWPKTSTTAHVPSAARHDANNHGPSPKAPNSQLDATPGPEQPPVDLTEEQRQHMKAINASRKKLSLPPLPPYHFADYAP